MKDLQSTAMLVKLSMSQWSAKKFDRKVTDKITSDYQAQSDAGRFNKSLLKSKELESISKIGGASRVEHYRLTLPWYDEGSRILPTTTFFEYTQKMAEFQSQFTSAVDEFISVYPQLIEDAKRTLVGMFNQMDYPPAKELRDKFEFSTYIYPIPSSSDFRVEMLSGTAAAIKADIDNRVQEQVKTAMQDCFDRAKIVVQAMVDRLSEEDPKFKDSLVQNVRDVVEILPSLNITNDENLTKTIEAIRTKLCVYPPDTLRKVASCRKDAVEEGRNILEIIDQYRI